MHFNLNIANISLVDLRWQITVTDDSMGARQQAMFSILLQYCFKTNPQQQYYQLPGSITNKFMEEITVDIWFRRYL